MPSLNAEVRSLSLAMLVAAFLVQPADGQSTIGSVYGFVRDAESGWGLPGATVRLDGSFSFVEEGQDDGAYVLSPLCGTGYTLTGSRPGYLFQRYQLDVQCGPWREQPVLLRPSRAFWFSHASSTRGVLGKQTKWGGNTTTTIGVTLYGLGLHRISRVEVQECAVSNGQWIDWNCERICPSCKASNSTEPGTVISPHWVEVMQAQGFAIMAVYPTDAFVNPKPCNASARLGPPSADGRSRPLTLTQITQYRYGNDARSDHLGCQLVLYDNYGSRPFYIPIDRYRLDVHQQTTVGTATMMIRGMAAEPLNPDSVAVSSVEPQAMTLVAGGDAGSVVIQGERFDRVIRGIVFLGEEPAQDVQVSDVLNSGPGYLRVFIKAGPEAESSTDYVLTLETEAGWVETGLKITVESSSGL